MPSYSAGASSRKYVILGIGLAGVALLLFLATRHRERSVHGLLTTNLEHQAKEVLVLLDEARSLCMDVASSTLEMRKKAQSRRDEKAEYLLPGGADEDLAFAAGILDLASIKYRTVKRTHLRLGPRLRADPIASDLEFLQSFARGLCYEVKRHGSPFRYESNVTLKLRSYTGHRARIEAQYIASDLEREQILTRLEAKIEGHRQQAIAMNEVDGEAKAWVPDDGSTDYEKKTPEQVRAERRDLQAEEQWRQRQAEQQENLHREAIDRWRSEPQNTQRAMPTVGLQEVDKDSITGITNEARSWAGVYRQATGPVTVALRRFDMIRRIEVDERTTRACRALFSKVSDLLQSERLFSSPIDKLNNLMRQAYTRAQKSAEACMAGDMAEANEQFDQAEQLFDRLETEFGLSPD